MTVATVFPVIFAGFQVEARLEPSGSERDYQDVGGPQGGATVRYELIRFSVPTTFATSRVAIQDVFRVPGSANHAPRVFNVWRIAHANGRIVVDGSRHID